MKTLDIKALVGAAAQFAAHAQPAPAPDPRVPYSARLRFSTLQQLKRHCYHSGQTEQDFVDAVLAAALAPLPDAARPMPGPKETALEKKRKK